MCTCYAHIYIKHTHSRKKAGEMWNFLVVKNGLEREKRLTLTSLVRYLCMDSAYVYSVYINIWMDVSIYTSVQLWVCGMGFSSDWSFTENGHRDIALCDGIHNDDDSHDDDDASAIYSKISADIFSCACPVRMCMCVWVFFSSFRFSHFQSPLTLSLAPSLQFLQLSPNFM